MPRISIITPVYIDTDAKVNWLDEMVQSVINQTITDWELILVDDKSPVSFDYVKVKHTDKRLRWLENATNSGPAKTRNSAAALAESDCLLPVDSDDVLASEEVLERMYEVWQQDKRKIIYGNLQLYQPGVNGQFTRGKVFQLADYSFDNTLDLRGVMPVTCMHSVECHEKSGGWKAVLDKGREDVEYWIAAGERGFCGQKINYTTLLYRRHDESRDYKLRHQFDVREMQNKIKEMHAPVYRGEYPMACCGKGAANAPSSPNADPVVLSASNQRVAKITELAGYNDNEKEWVTYQGGKKGSFSILVRGPNNLPSSYMVLGTGHAFQIHKRHHEYFSQRQHMGFRINQPDPRQQAEPEPPAPTPEPQVIEQPKPELATLVRLDTVGAQTRQAAVVAPAPVVEIKSSVSLDSLKLSDRIAAMLQHDLWTVEKLALAAISDLTVYDGIGIKTAQAIIDKAKKLINN